MSEQFYSCGGLYLLTALGWFVIEALFFSGLMAWEGTLGFDFEDKFITISTIVGASLITGLFWPVAICMVIYGAIVRPE